jgi:integrase
VSRIRLSYDAASFDFYSPEEVWVLVRAAGDEQDAAIFLTAGFAGLRRGEICALRLGGRLDASALRKRYHAARKAAGLRHVKLHGLHHGAGSLVARQSDAVFVQHFLGHSKMSTTERYMHAKSRKEDVERLNRAFGAMSSASVVDGVDREL